MLTLNTAYISKNTLQWYDLIFNLYFKMLDLAGGGAIGYYLLTLTFLKDIYFLKEKHLFKKRHTCHVITPIK